MMHRRLFQNNPEHMVIIAAFWVEQRKNKNLCKNLKRTPILRTESNHSK